LELSLDLISLFLRFFAITLDVDIESYSTINKTKLSQDDDIEALGDD